MYKNNHKNIFKIKKLVLVLILFAFFYSFNTNVKAAIVNIGDTENYGYTGDVQTFTAQFDGSYKLRVWGAQGGSVHGYDGGYGGYAEGNVYLHTGDTIYIYVGGQGVGATAVGQDLAGGYNGGGSVTGNSSVNHINASGGGATHVALVSGLLNTLESQKDKILIVAGGGGGARWQENYTEYSNGARTSYGGHGGGNTGSHVTQYGTYSWRETTNGVGTQTSGYQFGQGQNSIGNSAGGGGFYGGKSYDSSGAGGSGYIGNSKLKNKLMFMYSESPIDFVNDDEDTKTLSSMASSSEVEDRTAKKGNGYAKVTYVGSNDATLSLLSVTNYELDKRFFSNKHEYSLPILEESVETIEINAVANDINATVSGDGIVNVPYGKTSHEIIVTAQDGTVEIYRINLNREVTPKDKYTYNYTGDVQTFITPVTGKYKLETWGAQGGSVDGTYSGGYGAYSTGEIKLKQNDIVYIYVGGEGQSTTDGYYEDVAGGYNGGGAANVSSTSCSSATQYKSSGGGATHMATTSGLLNTLSSNRDKILIVSSGGGGGYYIQDENCYNEHAYTNGGSGAGYKSKVETLDSIDYTDAYTCYPSTQTSAGYCTYNGETKGAAAFGTGGSYMMGGGAGYYGGASGSSKKSQGGVSYIGNINLTDKHMTCYKCETSSEESTKTSSTACFSISPKEDCAKRGNGYAKITPLGIESEDATLKSLTVTNQELKQAFDPERLEYDLILDEDVTSVEINAEANDEKASLTYNQNVELTSNPQLEEIIVTAEDGTINVYSINIKRVKKSYLKKWLDTKFYLIADNQSDSITTLRKATTAEYNAAKDSFSDLNTISLANSPYPAYAWKDNDSILFYSEADIVYMNPDSMQYFTTFKNATSIDLSFFDTSKVTNMSFMFKDLSKLTSLDVSNFDTSKVTNMNCLFSGVSSITSLDVSNFDTSKVTYMNGTFANLKSLNDLDLSNFDTSNVTDMGSMFENTIVLDGIDLSSFDTSNVKNMHYMFYNTKTPKLDLKHFDVSKVNDFGSIFTLTDVDEIDISGWVFNVSSLSSIFYKSKVTKLILDDVDTSSLTTMRSMFSGLLKLKEVDLSSLDTENVTDMSYMFYASDSIETLDLSSFDTRKVTTMENMFTTNNSETALRSINLSSFKVYNVTTMYGMFENAKHLESIDLSSFDVSSVTTMERMFSNCNSLKTVDLSNFNSPQLTNISGMFGSNYNLERIYANESFSTENVVYSSVFKGCAKLVGGMGTMYSLSNIKSTYARVDDPENGRPGYFTYKEFKPTIYYPDDTFEEVTFNSLFTFPENWPKENENVSTVTFKYQNGEEDYISNVTKSFDLYRWKVNDSTYSPSSDKNIIADTYLEPIYNETIEGAEFPENPTSEHGTFRGWYTEPTGGERVTSYKGEEDITLYAHWNYDNMTISFEENGGEEISDITVPYRSEIGELPTTTKTGFILEGWYSDEELTNKVSSTKVVNDNMTLYAKWIEDDFPIVYQDDEEVFDGTNYLNTHIKLYNEENYLKDYEIGFTITEFDPALNQEENLTFVNAKYENESLGWPGLVVRYNYIKDTIGVSQSINGERKLETIEPLQINKKYRIIRKDNVVYYSVDNGELVEFQDTTGFNQFHEVETTFGASQDVDGNPFRFIHAKLSNMYIRLGEAHDDHMVTYPDGNVEIYPHNTIINLGNNNSTKSDEESATVTFKYHNGSEDTTSKVTTKYTANGFKIDDTHYDNSSNLLVDSDKVIEYDYDKLVSTTFPVNPTKEDEIFKGWYTEEDGGEKVTSYNGENDITLHARYAIDEATMMKGTDFKAKITALGDFKYFRKATEAEYNLVKSTLTDDNIVSDTNSPNEIYLWISGDNCLFYSEASNVYLNENSDSLFYNINGVEEIDISDLNTSRVTNMAHLFYNLPNLRSVDLTNIDTSNVTDMSGMFYGDKKLESIDLSDFVTDNVKNFSYLFHNCETLTELDLSDFNTSNATNMAHMFGSTKNITTLDLSNFDTKNVSNMIGMFTGMSKLKNLDISSFDTSNITDMGNMFNNCSSLEQLDISSFDTSRVRNFFQVFYGDYKLNTIFVSNKWTTAKIGTAYNNGMDVFTFAYDLIGQEGTEYDSQHKNVEYAHIDEGETNPGYLTDVSHKGEVHSVTFPDGTVEMKPHNTVIRFSRNLPAADKTEELGTVTFKYHNGNEDTTSTVVKNYIQNAYKVNNVHQDYNTGNVTNPNDVNTVSIRVNEDKVIEYDFDIETTGAEFPSDPTKENYIFTGWYTEEEDGEKVESLDNIDGDITLHAHFVKEMVTITTPNETIEVPKGEDYTLPTNDIDKVNDMVSTVTFKYHNDVDEDLTRNVEKQYTVNGWLINDTHYDDEEIINPTEDITLVPDYIETVIGAEFPSEPVREHYEFDGWYTEETGGEKIESYSLDEDIILHAHWIGETQTITTPDGEEEVPYGTEYTLGTNDTPKEDDTYTVTFKYHDDLTGDLEKEVTVEFTPNGWLVNDVHYDDEASFEVTENATIEPDYIETVIGAEFPSEPSKDNYEFVGWFDAEEDGTEYTEYNEKADIILHARWEITLPIDITIDSDDVTIVVGETHQIGVTFIPDGTTDTLTYTGYDNEKIDVTDGLITGLEKGETTITVGTENTDIEKTINVTVIDNKITSEVLDIKNKEHARIIVGEEPETIISDFLDKIDNPKEYLVVYDKDDNLINSDDYDSTLVTTGTKVKLVINGIEHDEVIAIIRGDLNEDGRVNVMDLSKVSDHILEKELIEGYKLYAADLVEDPEAEEDEFMINVMDQGKFVQYILENIDSLND